MTITSSTNTSIHTIYIYIYIYIHDLKLTVIISGKNDWALEDLPLTGVSEQYLCIDIDGITELDVAPIRITEAAVHGDDFELVNTGAVDKENSRVQIMTAKGLGYKIDIRKRAYRETQSKTSNMWSRLIEDVSTTEIRLSL